VAALPFFFFAGSSSPFEIFYRMSRRHLRQRPDAKPFGSTRYSLEESSSITSCGRFRGVKRGHEIRRSVVPRQKKSKEISEGRQQSIFSAVPALEQPSESIDELRAQALSCKACDLWKNATQTVFGEGSRKATIMFVGEQPGDQEDLAGHPFVGPAGRVLHDALVEAGIQRSEVYVTNAVKHFKWVPAERGKRRIHKKPRTSEVQACRPWLEAEVRAVKPQVLVGLGATAAQSLFGKDFSVTRQRGKLIDSPLAPYALATVHPSSILRAPDEAARHEQRAAFVADLVKVAELSHSSKAQRRKTA
jgi:uracil-DNA glycosylase family protein